MSEAQGTTGTSNPARKMKPKQQNDDLTDLFRQQNKLLQEQTTHIAEMKREMQSDCRLPIDQMLVSLDYYKVPACSIYSVPHEFGDQKQDAFKPTVISIGPLHRRATRHLQMMEQPKWVYMEDFVCRSTRSPPNVVLKESNTSMVKLENIIRESYGDHIELELQDFARLMMVDGFSLLELLTRLAEYMELQGNERIAKEYPEDPIFETEEKVVSVLNDITMLENQIPFMVLKKLYGKVLPDPDGTDESTEEHDVANIVCKVFGCPLKDNTGGAHILHLIHLSTVEQIPQQGKHARKELLRCAIRLKAAGVTIQPKPNSMTIQHKLVGTFNFEISFNELGQLEIPPLHIKETTEVKWRNLIAWEQSNIRIRGQYTSYALFFAGLICSKHDVKVLQEIGVIVNESKKSRKDLLTMFRTISMGTKHMDSSYSEVCGNLNVYRRKKIMRAMLKLPIITWHLLKQGLEMVEFYGQSWYMILIRDHIPTVWKFIGVVAAIMLLALTVMQTYYSVRSSD